MRIMNLRVTAADLSLFLFVCSNESDFTGSFLVVSIHMGHNIVALVHLGLSKLM